MKAIQKNIEALFIKLCKSKAVLIPKKGSLAFTTKLGVYVIYNLQLQPLYVGRTSSANKGINQRITNHLNGSSTFSKNYLKPNRISLRRDGKVKYVVVDDAKERAYLEALSIGKLCPEYIGLHLKK